MRPPTLAVLAISLVATCTAAPSLDIGRVKDLRLDNGLHVVVKEEPVGNLVAAGFCIKASPLYETPEQQGASDLVRHLLTVPAGEGKTTFADEINDLGGSLESFTSPDETQITFALATQAFRELFPAVVKGIMEPTFSEAVWAEQLPRLRQALTDARSSPLGMLSTTTWETAFQKHPYGRPLSGTPESLAALNAQDLADYHRAMYVPDNMSLVVVGSIKAEEVFELARKHLGAYPSRPVTPPQVTQEPPQTDSRIRLETAPTRGTLVSYAWHAADIRHKRDVCSLDLIYAILSQGKDARLVKALGEACEEGVAPDVEFVTKRDQGLFIITTVSQADKEFDAREAVLGEVDKLRTEKLAQADLDLAKDLICASYAFDNANYVQQVGSISFYEAIDTYKFAFDYADEVRKVTVEDIQRVAQLYLGSSSFTLVIVRPRTPTGAAKEARLTP